MDKDRVGGIGKKLAGSIKEVCRKVTGDGPLEAEGRAQKVPSTG